MAVFFRTKRRKEETQRKLRKIEKLEKMEKMEMVEMVEDEEALPENNSIPLFLVQSVHSCCGLALLLACLSKFSSTRHQKHLLEL
ncbi:uncharacterized protein ASCRUDRAFT_74458, partial [Ascoidea rubescens DSM 1968]